VTITSQVSVLPGKLVKSMSLTSVAAFAPTPVALVSTVVFGHYVLESTQRASVLPDFYRRDSDPGKAKSEGDSFGSLR
jgi:hypothetical protein